MFICISGKCYIVHKNGRQERVIDAHKGAVMKTKWNHDGTSLLTSGEDGQLKIWSRSGMLRSTHAQAESPIYAAVWSPFSSGVLYSSGKIMTIQPFGSNSKVTKHSHHSIQLGLVIYFCLFTDYSVDSSRQCRAVCGLVPGLKSNRQRWRRLPLQNLGFSRSAAV